MAITLPDEVKDLLKSIQTGLDRGFKAVSWVRPESIHLTLKFLGEIDEKKALAIAAALETAAEGIGPFTLEAGGVGVFPNPRAPRVVWAGVKDNSELLTLQKKIDERLAAAGFEPDDRPFTPHLTLCRIKSAGDARAIGNLVTGPGQKEQARAAFTVNSFAFMKSVLKPQGAVHTVIKEFALRG